MPSPFSFLFFFPVLLLCLVVTSVSFRHPSHVTVAQARRGSATNDSDRDNWDWLQTHFVLSVAHRAVFIFYRLATSWRECLSVAINHVDADKYSKGPRFCFVFSPVFVSSSLSHICVLLSAYYSCSLCVFLTAPQLRLPSISHPKLSDLKHFMFKLFWRSMCFCHLTRWDSLAERRWGFL